MNYILLGKFLQTKRQITVSDQNEAEAERELGMPFVDGAWRIIVLKALRLDGVNMIETSH